MCLPERVLKVWRSACDSRRVEQLEEHFGATLITPSRGPLSPASFVITLIFCWEEPVMAPTVVVQKRSENIGEREGGVAEGAGLLLTRCYKGSESSSFFFPPDLD